MRPSRHETMLDIAGVIAKRSTCSRRQVGCVLTDQNGRIIGVGHNGVPRGQTHCTELPCAGSTLESGQGLHICQAVHAEQNAMMFCADVMAIAHCYVTASPCMHCMKMLLNTSCNTLVYDELYDHDALVLWFSAKRRDAFSRAHLMEALA